MMDNLQAEMIKHPCLTSSITMIARVNEARLYPPTNSLPTVVQGRIQDAVMNFATESEREKHVFSQYFELWKDFIITLREKDMRYEFLVEESPNPWTFNDTAYLQMKKFKETLTHLMTDKDVGMIMLKKCE